MRIGGRLIRWAYQKVSAEVLAGTLAACSARSLRVAVGGADMGTMAWVKAEAIDHVVDSNTAFEPSDYVRLFSELFEHSSDAVWITRLEDGVLYEANGAFLSLFGVSRREAVGHSTAELGLWVYPSEREAVVRRLRETGRIERCTVRLRSVWSEEFSLLVSEVVVPWRRERVILGIGALAR